MVVLLSGFFLFSAPGPAPAETGARSFKVVKPPAPGARKRLTVTTVLRGRPPGGAGGGAERHGWFWRIASPARSAADRTRLLRLADAAAARLGGGGVDAVAGAWKTEIAAAARAAGISEALLAAVVTAESGGNARAVSSAGAQGLGQLIPATARRFNVRNPFDPAENLRGAAEYLSFLLGMFDEDALLALAAYNAGENAVERNRGVPPYAETRDYVPIVLANFAAARRLCLPAPEGPRDACILTAAPRRAPTGGGGTGGGGGVRPPRGDWFWAEADPALSAASPERTAALAAEAASRVGGAALREALAAIGERWRAEIAAAARAGQVSEALLLAIVAAESGGDPAARGPGGRKGLTLLTPEAARLANVKDPFDPAENLRGAADMLSRLLSRFGEDAMLALAGWNAGEAALLSHDGVPPDAETRNWTPVVLGYWGEARSLCLFAAEGPRAPCPMSELP